MYSLSHHHVTVFRDTNVRVSVRDAAVDRLADPDPARVPASVVESGHDVVRPGFREEVRFDERPLAVDGERVLVGP